MGIATGCRALYNPIMTIETHWLVYPDGERQETDRVLRMNDIVDMNGNPLPLPPPTDRMIAYRLYKMRRVEERGELDLLFYLELIPAWELASMMR
ncbi:MAG TPA: hypothetical protein DCG47_06080 [Spirochaetaceae bacterium]|jgi:hypothetical protein|nr:hypothetical protein [Spirochaetaceae bacterium]